MLSVSTDPPVFLRNKWPFYLTLIVIVTTLFSWFNINSICIMALLLLRLLDGGPVKTLRAAFSNKYFLAWFSLFLIELIGLAYSHHPEMGWKYVERKATLAAIPLILCAGPFTDPTGRKKLMSAYCGLLLLTCLYCLLIAGWRFSLSGDSSVFFYHLLSSPLDQNAIFFSGYIICALLFLLSYPLDLGYRRGASKSSAAQTATWLQPRAAKGWRIAGIIFFSGMIVLLSSKLLLIFLILVLVAFSARRYKFRTHPGLVAGLMLTGGILIGLLFLTQNPIKERYQDIAQGGLALTSKDKLPPGTDFNGLNLRLVIWRFGFEILREHKAWIAGVSAGESQDLLNKKYIAAGMWTGISGTRNHGFLEYNFHNQYIEILVRSGLIGLTLLLITCGLMIGLALKRRTPEAVFTVAMILFLFFTESMLEMQHSMFLSCFFPLLLLYDAPASGLANKAAGQLTGGTDDMTI
jgi:O-antigen ligase